MIWMLLLVMANVQADVLQTPPFEGKDDAKKILSISKRMLRKEKGLSIKQGRFLVPKKGYRYRVVIEGVSGEEKALELAKRLHSIWTSVELITTAGQTKRFDGEKDFQLVLPEESLLLEDKKEEEKVVENTEIVTAERATAIDLEVKKKGGIQPSITDILNQARVSMDEISKRWDGITSEKFVFERELLHNGKKVRVHHRFFQKGDAMRLDITMKEGEGENSTTVLTPAGKGLLSIKDQRQERSAARTQEILKTFTSNAQLSILTNFSKDVQSNGPWRTLDGLEKLENAWRLYRTDDQIGGVIKQAIFSEKEAWLIQLIVQDEEGELEYRWTDYTDIGDGTSIPFRITRIRNGFVQETVVIENLYFDIPLDEGVFSLE